MVDDTVFVQQIHLLCAYLNFRHSTFIIQQLHSGVSYQVGFVVFDAYSGQWPAKGDINRIELIVRSLVMPITITYE